MLTGFRSGLGGAAQKFDIPTDLVTYGKVISGLGLPLSAIGGRADILDISQTSGQSWTDFGQKTGLQGSHTGNYLSVAASLATLQLLRDKGPAYYTELRAKVDRVQARLAAFRAAEGIPLRMVGFGDYIGCFQFLPEDSYTDYRVYSRALNPATFILTLLLRKRGIYTLGMPMFLRRRCSQRRRRRPTDRRRAGEHAGASRQRLPLRPGVAGDVRVGLRLLRVGFGFLRLVVAVSASPGPGQFLTRALLMCRTGRTQIAVLD